jgi:hypothetical protein
MAEIFRRVIGLHLRAQHDFVYQPFMLAAARAFQDGVEMHRPQALALGKTVIQAVEEFAQAVDLVVGRRLVHAVHAWLPALFQFFRCRDIRRDHEIFNHLMTEQVFARFDGSNMTILADEDAALGSDDGKRLARFTRLVQRGVAGIKRLQDRL